MKVEVKEAQSNEVLQQGDYVTNLTKEQFDELIEIENKFKFSWRSSKTNVSNFISKSIMYNGCRLIHSEILNIKNQLLFEEFKQRSINTFKEFKDGKEN